MCTDCACVLHCLIQTRTYSWQADKFLSPTDPPPGLHDINGPITIWQIFLYTDNRKNNAPPNPHSTRSPRCCCVLEFAENAIATVCLPLLQNKYGTSTCDTAQETNNSGDVLYRSMWLLITPPPPLWTPLSEKCWFLQNHILHQLLLKNLISIKFKDTNFKFIHLVQIL